MTLASHKYNIYLHQFYITHSYLLPMTLPRQVNPSPVKPLLQTHLKISCTLMHLPSVLQLSAPTSHTLLSARSRATLHHMVHDCGFTWLTAITVQVTNYSKIQPTSDDTTP